MLSFVALVVLSQLPGQPWHYEKRCDGRTCVMVKVYDPMPPAKITPPKLNPLPELVRVPPAPVVEPLPPERQFFFGVDDDKRTDKDRYAIGDREVSRDQLHREFDAAGGDMLPDDAQKPYLTLYGKDEATRKDLAALVADASLAAVRDRYRIQVYDTSHPVDRAMTDGIHPAADERFQKTGRLAVVQYAADTGNSPIVGWTFDFPAAPDLLAAVPKMDPQFKLPATPTRPTPHDAQNGDKWAVAIFAFALIFLLAVVRSIPPAQTKG